MSGMYGLSERDKRVGDRELEFDIGGGWRSSYHVTR